MAVEILMPELGESVHEGTVSRWLKQVGDFVKEDEPVVEIMTDKVNTELGAPASGILVKITIPEGELVEVFAEMGVIEPDEAKAKEMIGGNGGTGSAPAAEAPAAKEEAAPAPAAETPAAAPVASDGERRFYTPVVRAIAKQNGLTEADLAGIAGSGQGGRVTKTDVEQFLANRGKTPSAPPAAQSSAPVAAPSTPAATSKEFKAPSAPVEAGPDQEIVPLAGMRKMIAEAMERSSQVPVVSTLIDVDVTPLVEYRSVNKDVFVASHGVKLTYTPFFIKALAETLEAFPMLNASLQDGKIVMNKGVHMGIAVSLGKDGEGGLIVPVIRDCHTKTLVQIARDLDEIAAKARSNQLGVPDVQGGTFTLTNPGSYGAVLGTPMINAPQSGIAGVYGIKQTPVIINGMIAIRSVMNVVLTYDHRLVDGLTAGRFLQQFKQKLESMDFFK
ncbi:MAG: 2-oxo acid dehydrogenase subunit E2 [Fimbriimonadaceae bacterium]|nr:MAG: 2-oxo acid dehydrogenase subunit E2 [Fimbriimonadaceae bacterium]